MSLIQIFSMTENCIQLELQDEATHINNAENKSENVQNALIRYYKATDWRNSTLKLQGC